MRGLYYGAEYYSSWIMFVLPAMLLALYAQATIKKRYYQYSKISSKTGYTGAGVARLILDRNGLEHVQIQRARGELSDHYDPRTKVIRLSEGVFDSSSIAALGIAAHEVGHAIQDGTDYTFLRFRNAIAPLASIGSNLVWTLIFLGFIISSFFIELAIVLFLGVVVFQIVTLPVEINASRRALYQLENNIIPSDEINGVRKVLKAAALTYVAATLVSIGELLRILAITNNRRDR